MEVLNGCSYRIWLDQYANGSGYSLCIKADSSTGALHRNYKRLYMSGSQPAHSRPPAVMTAAPPGRHQPGWWRCVCGRHVEGGVAVEEAVWPQLEPDAGDRHHRPVLRAHHVASGERMPQHQVGVFQWAVGRGPGRQVIPARMLVRVIPGREPLIGIVGGDPQVPGGELGPPHHVGVGLAEGSTLPPDTGL